MKKPALSFEAVSKEITEMLLSGEKITIRNVMSRVGGKTTTIADYLRRWHLQNDEKMSNYENTLSDEVVQAILNEQSLAIAVAVTRHKTQIKYLEGLVQELNEMIGSKEKQLEEKCTELQHLNEKRITENAKIQEQNAGYELLNKELKQQLATLQEKLEIVSNEKHEAIKEAAVWQTKYEQQSSNTNPKSKLAAK